MSQHVTTRRLVRIIPWNLLLEARRQRPDRWPDIEKAMTEGRVVVGSARLGEYMIKGLPGVARGGKYIRRVLAGVDPRTGRQTYRYVYADVGPGGEHIDAAEDDAGGKPRQLDLFGAEPTPAEVDLASVPEDDRQQLSLLDGGPALPSLRTPLTVVPPPADRTAWARVDATMQLLALTAGRVFAGLKGLFGLADVKQAVEGEPPPEGYREDGRLWRKDGLRLKETGPGRVAVDLTLLPPERWRDVAETFVNDSGSGWEAEFATGRRVREDTDGITDEDLKGGLFVLRQYGRSAAAVLDEAVARARRAGPWVRRLRSRIYHRDRHSWAATFSRRSLWHRHRRTSCAHRRSPRH